MENNPLKVFLENLAQDPWTEFERWYSEALKIDTPNPNALYLSVCDAEGNPSCRTVLLSEYSPESGFLFYTNYASKKSKAMEENSKAEILFYWDSLFLQVRIFGEVYKLSAKQSDYYFLARTREKKITAWASIQSQEMLSPQDLILRYQKYKKKFEGKDVPRPEFWGGWGLKPLRFEFWKGNQIRMHKRAIYDLTGGNSAPRLLYP